MPQAAGQVKFWTISIVKNIFSIYANNFCDAGQVSILRSLKAWLPSRCQAYQPSVSIFAQEPLGRVMTSFKMLMVHTRADMGSPEDRYGVQVSGLLWIWNHKPYISPGN